MEILILLGLIGVAGIFAGHHIQRKQQKHDYELYMAQRIVFETSEVNSED